MKRYFLCLAPLISTILPAAASPDNPLIPDTWFHELSATDGSTQQCIIFTTVPGFEYTFEHSDALNTWTEIGKTYGLGHEFAAAIRETAPSPPPPDPGNPPPASPDLSNASILIQPSSDTVGGTVVSWPSLDHGSSVRYLIAGNMSTDWDSVPIFAETHGSHQFFITHPPGTAAPPEANPLLESNDAAMIADLEAGFSAFNTAVANAAAIARNTPPPPPPAPDSKGFWRIKADWSLDSDSDGILDHAEFAYAAANAAGQDGLAGNAFSSDTNNDGIPDGQQLDSDGDGIPDALDIAPSDSLVAYEAIALPRFAMFTFSDRHDLPYEDQGTGRAIAINDRGTVLFPDRVWKAGEFHTLVTEGPGVPFQGEEYARLLARAINDQDGIIGSGNVDYIYEGPFESICYWANSSAFPEQVLTVAGVVTTYAEISDHRYSQHLGNDGSFYAKSLSINYADAEPVKVDLGWRKWTLPAGDNALSSAPAADFSMADAPGGIVWGSEYASWNQWVQSNITSPSTVSIPLDPNNLLVQAENGTIVATTSSPNGTTIVRKDGQWRISPLLGNAVDIAADGTAIGKKVSSQQVEPAILLNGKWTPLERAAPGIPERWKTSTAISLSDTSPGGWILAHDRPGDPVTPDDISAALLPLRFKGQYTDSAQNLVEEAVGVDDFSIGSSSPDLSPLGETVQPIREKIWIMAPLGGSKTIQLGAPLHTSARLKISATGLSFGSQAETILDASGQAFTVSANPGTTSGTEIDAYLEINDGTYDTPSVSTPLAFKVMKARTVNVTVYKVGETVVTGNGTTQLDADLVPAQLQLEEFLEGFFEAQVNASFAVDIKPIQVNATIDYEPDGKFTSGQNELSPDQVHVQLDAIDQAGAPDAATNITIYLLGTNKPINTSAVGATDLATRTCWVKAKEKNPARTEEELAQVMNTIAHEIGHVMIGAGHPGASASDESGGPAPLPGTNHSKRLMRAGGNNPTGFDHLLVKAEWDKIEDWLTAVVDTPPTP